ncbi:hypothetical protein TNCV_4881161 [Trichonephila clavipes]|nr:hypothetical protein TNCV_4881161 [Trichonephila clavipes]
MAKFPLHCDLRYFSTTEKISRHRIRAHYEQLSEFKGGRIIRLKEAIWANQRITRHTVEAMRPLEDAGKNGWTTADFSAMMVAVDLAPFRSGGQIDCPIHCHIDLFIVISHQTCGSHTSVEHGYSQTGDRAKFTLVPTAMPPATPACTTSSQITEVLGSTS